MQKKGAMVREKGSIIVSDRSTTWHKVHDAYVKAETERRNTREEKERGKCNWTGGREGATEQGELQEKEDNDLWTSTVAI